MRGAGLDFRMSDPDPTAWFCLQSKPKCEHIAAAHLRRLEGVEVFCPRLRFQRATKRGKVWFTEALFPCYLFARFDPVPSLRAVRYSQGVTRIVGFGGGMPTVPDEVIEGLREEVGGDEPYEMKGEIEVGDEVLVAEGPMKGLRGLVTHQLDGTARVRILLEFLGEQRLVEIEKESLGADADPRRGMG